MSLLIASSKEILSQAIADYKPYAKVLLFSGGGDSMTALQVCLASDVVPDYIIHVNTRTGIAQTTQFVREFVQSIGIKYIEADAGSTYEDYVLRKGFYGVGTGGLHSAHTLAYHTLKRQHLRRAIASIRQRKRGRNILLINGARQSESLNRAKNFQVPIRQEGANVWVNVIHEWDKDSCQAFCQERRCPINPVSKELCRSGECMCGTTQGFAAREEASFFYPKWGRWLDGLEARVKERFPWGWGEPIPKTVKLEKEGQLNLFTYQEEHQPMCNSCLAQAVS